MTFFPVAYHSSICLCKVADITQGVPMHMAMKNPSEIELQCWQTLGNELSI